jgi:tetratricopeptide (TPR) repeat protein
VPQEGLLQLGIDELPILLRTLQLRHFCELLFRTRMSEDAETKLSNQSPPAMGDRKTNRNESGAHRWGSLRMQCWILASTTALLIATYTCIARPGVTERLIANPSQNYYNLLVEGFRDGKLSLKKQVPPGLLRLNDPYDPSANLNFCRVFDLLVDLSYYKGSLFLYFGVTPALVLFWPAVALTGHYVSYLAAVVLFSSLGFVTSVCLLCALWRRHYSDVNTPMVVSCVFALALASGVPVTLLQSDVYEVPTSCGYMFTMLALGAIWRTLHAPRRQCGWMAAASAAYGLAIGARPNLAFGAVILLLPVIKEWRERRRIWSILAAAIGPIAVIGLGLMLYNALRFDDPFEFGVHYQLSVRRLISAQLFSLRYFWLNFRVYFIGLERWKSPFPYVHHIGVESLPKGYLLLTDPFGVLFDVPLVWFALALPLVWRRVPEGGTTSPLKWFVAVTCLLFGTGSFILMLYSWASGRYEMDFLPALVVAAVIGILELEHLMARSGTWLSRILLRLVWGGCLSLSVLAIMFEAIDTYAFTNRTVGNVFVQRGRLTEAIRALETSLRIEPDSADGQNSLGIALIKAGRVQEAVSRFETAVRIDHDFAEAQGNLGNALLQEGRVKEALDEYIQVLRIHPDDAKAHNNIGIVLARVGSLQEAIRHYEDALRYNPDYAEAYCNLANALKKAGRVSEAIQRYEQALQLKPEYVDAYEGLGIALARTGRLKEAIENLAHATRLDPDSAEAHCNLGVALGEEGHLQEAIENMEEALRLKPDYAEAHSNLGIALEREGRVKEAIRQYEEALRIKPDFVEAQHDLARARASQ